MKTRKEKNNFKLIAEYPEILTFKEMITILRIDKVCGYKFQQKNPNENLGLT